MRLIGEQYAGSEPAKVVRRGGLLDRGVVQIFPTAACESDCTHCAHCYSSSESLSGGERRCRRLDFRDLLVRLSRLSDEGYSVLKVAGGEALAYPNIVPLARHASAMGYEIELRASEMMIEEATLAPLRGFVSRFTISIDGTPNRTDGVVENRGRLDRTIEAMKLLREQNIRFGVSHCVTYDSMVDLPWLASFAESQGASTLAIHPLTVAGRAQRECASLSMTSKDLERVSEIVERLRGRHPSLAIDLEVADLKDVEAFASRVLPQPVNPEPRLSDLVNPVILDESGRLWPLAQGMHPTQCLVPAARDRWDSHLAYEKKWQVERMRDLVESTLDRLEGGPRFVDWYGEVVRQSHLQTLHVLRGEKEKAAKGARPAEARHAS